MGQFHDSMMTTRVKFDENDDNGLVVGNVYLPEELLAEIFCYVDHKSLLNCQMVCKRWKTLIQSYVWRKKADMSLNQNRRLHSHEHSMPWKIYYIICARQKTFDKNLLKNNCGERGKQYWEILSDGGDGWKVENVPVGTPPLPSDDPVFEGKQSCFVTSYHTCAKVQVIDLTAEGFPPDFLDIVQPPILVSEWYSCRWDCPAVYEWRVSLLGLNNEKLATTDLRDNMDGERQNQWHHVSHEFRKYGRGVRKVSFYHGGQDRQFWAGNYGCKMAGASVCVKRPTFPQHLIS